MKAPTRFSLLLFHMMMACDTSGYSGMPKSSAPPFCENRISKRSTTSLSKYGNTGYGVSSSKKQFDLVSAKCQIIRITEWKFVCSENEQPVTATEETNPGERCLIQRILFHSLHLDQTTTLYFWRHSNLLSAWQYSTVLVKLVLVACVGNCF